MPNLEYLKLEVRIFDYDVLKSRILDIKKSLSTLLLPTSKRSISGFTLVELMIAVVIITVLAIMGLVVFTGLQKGARDAKRRADLQSYAQAFENSYNVMNFNHYRALTVTDFAGGEMPADPLSSRSYTGTGAFITPPATGYCICAHLELANGNSDQDAPTGSCFTPSSGSSANYFCLRNQR